MAKVKKRKIKNHNGGHSFFFITILYDEIKRKTLKNFNWYSFQNTCSMQESARERESDRERGTQTKTYINCSLSTSYKHKIVIDKLLISDKV